MLFFNVKISAEFSADNFGFRFSVRPLVCNDTSFEYPGIFELSSILQMTRGRPKLKKTEKTETEILILNKSANHETFLRN